jgi:hypothetical protein
MNRHSWILRVLLGLSIASALVPVALAQQQPQQAPPPASPPAGAPGSAAGGAPAATDVQSVPHVDPEIDAATMPLQQYVDSAGRFGLVAPARWGRLPSASPDEVVFESDSGDNLRVSVAPLKVDPKAFSAAYVDTYLKVLSQSFSNVKFIGQRDVTVNFRKATDYVFSAEYGDTPVTCHQVVLFGADKVLYLTFAGFGKLRSQTEQLFETSLQSLWVSTGFGGATTASVVDPNAPAYVLAIPEGWVDQGPGDGTSHMFRPPSSRVTSAFISTRVTKIAPDDQHKAVDDAFLAAYAETLRGQHPENTFDLRQTRKIFLGGEPAVRYDFGYISNYGIRRAVLVLCVRKGYLVGISCDSADQSYPIYEQAFESLVTTFKFK